jgi:hypothetical protein
MPVSKTQQLRNKIFGLISDSYDGKLINKATFGKLNRMSASAKSAKLGNYIDKLERLIDIGQKFSYTSMNEVLQQNNLLFQLPNVQIDVPQQQAQNIYKITFDMFKPIRENVVQRKADRQTLEFEGRDFQLIKANNSFYTKGKNIAKYRLRGARVYNLEADINDRTYGDFIHQQALQYPQTEGLAILIEQLIQSETTLIRITSIIRVPNPVQPQPIQNIQLQASRVPQMLSNKYISYDVNSQAKKFHDLFVYKPNVDNYRPNSCLFTAFLDYFGASIKKIVPKQYKAVPTYETLFQMCFPDVSVPEEMSCSIQQFIPVLQYYKIKLTVYSEEANGPVFLYEPKTLNKHMKNTWWVFIKNNHIYNLNHDLPSLSRKHFEEKTDVQVSSEYHLEENAKYTKYINSLDEICSINWDKIQEKTVYIALNEDLTEIYFNIRKTGVEPVIGCCGQQITTIKLRINDKWVVLFNPGFNECDRDVDFDSESYYKQYHSLESQLSQSVLTKNNVSVYHPNLINNLKLLTPKAMKCRWNKKKFPSSFVGEIDINKAYLSVWMKMEKLPVFSFFDKFIEYNGEPIDANSFYITETIGKLPSKAHEIVFTNPDVNLLAGSVLNQFTNDIFELPFNPAFFKIVAVAKPYVLQPNNTKPIIESIWKSDLSTEHKKFIPNKIFGLIEKLCNRISISKAFGNIEDASRYLESHKGFLDKIIHEECVEVEDEELGGTVVRRKPVDEIHIVKHTKSNELMNGFYPIKTMLYSMMRFELFQLVQQYENTYNILGLNTDAIYVEIPKSPKIASKDIFYEENNHVEIKALTQPLYEELKLMENNLWYMFKLPFNESTTEIYETEREIILNKIEKIEKTLKKTSVLIKSGNNVSDITIDKFHQTFAEVNKIKNEFKGVGLIKGCVKDMDNISLKEIDNYTHLKNKFEIAPVVQANEIILENEINFTQPEYQQEFNQLFNQHKKVVIEASVPGAGKTTLFKKYIQTHNLDKHEYVIITPYNVLALENSSEGFTSQTLHKYFNLSLDGNAGHIDVNGVKLIIFDEIYSYSFSSLLFIHRFISEHPDIMFGATGDSNQNKPVDSILQFMIDSDRDPKQYYNEIVSQIFQNKITLNISKRLKTEEERQLLNKIRTDILIHKLPTKHIIQKYFQKIITISPNHQHICYLNETVKKVGQIIHDGTVKQLKQTIRKQVINGQTYYQGQKLVCRNGSLRVGASRLYTNYEYTIQSFSKEFISISDIFDNEVIHLPYSLLTASNFIFSGANTCHSVQGMTYNKPIVIHDINFDMITPEWLWTAITRNTSLFDVFYFETPSISIGSIKNTIEHRIEQHKDQDMKANRPITPDYITVPWVMKRLRHGIQCARCANTCDIDSSNLNSFSIDRLDNDLPHIESNCQIVCRHCNVSTH